MVFHHFLLAVFYWSPISKGAEKLSKLCQRCERERERKTLNRLTVLFGGVLRVSSWDFLNPSWIFFWGPFPNKGLSSEWFALCIYRDFKIHRSIWYENQFFCRGRPLEDGSPLSKWLVMGETKPVITRVTLLRELRITMGTYHLPPQNWDVPWKGTILNSLVFRGVQAMGCSKQGTRSPYPTLWKVGKPSIFTGYLEDPSI